MRRGFIIEAEFFSVVADGMNAWRHFNITARALRRARFSPVRVVDRVGRILRKSVQDVGDQQFLMLLLVVQPDLDDRKHALCVRRRHLRNQALDRRIDMGAICSDILAVRTGDQATLRPRMPRASRDVVGIEKKRKSLVEDPVVRIVRHQQKLFEKPGDVGTMPFCRARVGHRLHDLVFWRKT